MKISGITLISYTFVVIQLISILRTTYSRDESVVGYYELEPTLFGPFEWRVDSINSNNKHCFKSIFWYKPVAYCLRFRIILDLESEPNRTDSVRSYIPTNQKLSNTKQNVSVIFYYQTEKNKYVLKSNTVIVHGKFLIYPNQAEKHDDCPNENFLSFVYTDYTNVIVLASGNAKCGPQIMIFRSFITSLTYLKRMELVESKIGHVLNLTNMVQVGFLKCLSKPILEMFEEAVYLQCKEFNTLKSKKKKEFYKFNSNNIFLLLLILSSLLWIIIYGVHWISNRRSRTLIGPA